VLYFVRHGESQANVDQVFAGIKRPAPLTRIGRQQARLAGQGILDMKIGIDQIVSSPLARARETAEIIADSLGLDPAGISFDARLIQYDVGALTGESTQEVTPAQPIGAMGAEYPVAFQARVLEALGDAARREAVSCSWPTLAWAT
jgi:probable phosphoglycerate mutase